jgi:DNA-binding FadR family transcriptional regulator
MGGQMWEWDTLYQPCSAEYTVSKDMLHTRQTSSTHTISYAAELATDPQTNKIRRSSYSARSHAVLRLTRYGDWIRCFFVSTGQHFTGTVVQLPFGPTYSWTSHIAQVIKGP